MLSVEIAERNFCSHWRSAREPSPENPARPGSASCCAISVHATRVRAASVTKLRRITHLTDTAVPRRRNYMPHSQHTRSRIGSRRQLKSLRPPAEENVRRDDLSYKFSFSEATASQLT